MKGKLTDDYYYYVQALQREANFRYSLVRVRDNVESIAFYGGESHEAATIKVLQLLCVIFKLWRCVMITFKPLVGLSYMFVVPGVPVAI